MLLLGGTTLGLAIALAWLWSARGGVALGGVDEEAYRARTRELVSGAGGIWDSHPDPDVGRVLMPALEGRKDYEVLVRSNAFGVREKAYVLPKPEDVVRVVLLGDSMVFGHRIQEEKRLGVHLAELLAPPAAAIGKNVEVLHLGESAWNLRAECSFVRRQLSLLRPDVVLQIAVRNDLDDNPSVRGFGAMADFTDQWRDHADGTITDTHPRFLGAGPSSFSPLIAALDFESRSRFEAAALDVKRLRDAVTAGGGRYVLILLDPAEMPAALRYFGGVLAADEIACLPALDAEMRLGPNDAHWNARGMRLVAEYCYGLLRARRSLPSLELAALPSADELFANLGARAEKAAHESKVEADFEEQIKSAISFDARGADRAELRQVHGGVLPPGVVLPYASMIVRNEGASRLQIDGIFLDRGELRGGGVDVYVEEERVGRIELGVSRSPEEPFERSFALPEPVRARKFVSVRFVADDWILEGHDLRRCVCFRLRRVQLLE